MLADITKSEFAAIKPSMRVIVHDHPRRFARIQAPNAVDAMAISWRSDVVEPFVLQDQRSMKTWIGVDLRLVCITGDGEIHFSIGLASSLLQIQLFGDVTVAVCETQLLMINQDASIRSVCELIDIPDSVDFQDDKVVVTSIDGVKQSFSV